MHETGNAGHDDVPQSLVFGPVRPCAADLRFELGSECAAWICCVAQLTSGTYVPR